MEIVLVFMVVIMCVFGYCVSKEIFELKKETRHQLLKMLDIIDAICDEVYKKDEKD